MSNKQQNNPAPEQGAKGRRNREASDSNNYAGLIIAGGFAGAAKMDPLIPNLHYYQADNSLPFNAHDPRAFGCIYGSSSSGKSQFLERLCPESYVVLDVDVVMHYLYSSWSNIKSLRTLSRNRVEWAVQMDTAQIRTAWEFTTFLAEFLISKGFRPFVATNFQFPVPKILGRSIGFVRSPSSAAKVLTERSLRRHGYVDNNVKDSIRKYSWTYRSAQQNASNWSALVQLDDNEFISDWFGQHSDEVMDEKQFNRAYGDFAFTILFVNEFGFSFREPDFVKRARSGFMKKVAFLMSASTLSRDHVSTMPWDSNDRMDKLAKKYLEDISSRSIADINEFTDMLVASEVEDGLSKSLRTATRTQSTPKSVGSDSFPQRR